MKIPLKKIVIQPRTEPRIRPASYGWLLPVIFVVIISFVLLLWALKYSA